MVFTTLSLPNFVPICKVPSPSISLRTGIALSIATLCDGSGGMVTTYTAMLHIH